MGANGRHPSGLMPDSHSESNLESDQGNVEMVTFNRNEPRSPTATEETDTLMKRDGAVPHEATLLQPKIRYLPIATFGFIISSFIITYIIAVIRGSVEPDFPYISHTAIEAPERCIFAQLVNMGALMLAAVVYMRYIQLEAYLILISAVRCDMRFNKASLVTGLFSAFGLSMVANFQTNVMRETHYVGAFMAFICGVVFCWLQTSLSVRHSRWTRLTVVQIVNSVIVTICFFAFATSKAVYRIKEAAGHGTKHDILRDVYLVSTSTEWLTAFFIVFFLLTFYRDFSNIQLQFATVTIIKEDLVRKYYRFNSRLTDVTV